MQAQTTTAAMSTTAELLTAYFAAEYMSAERKNLARAIIQGDTSGKMPAKNDRVYSDDCAGEYFIPAILAVKPGKLTPAQAVAPLASRDELRPAMNCVYYDATRGAAVATCGHVLMSFPCGPLAPVSGLLHPVTLEPVKVGDVVNKIFMGTCEGNARYPDYVNVIRLPNPSGPAATLDVQAFRNQLAGIARAQRFVNLYTGIRARIQHAGQDFYVDAALCGNVLRAMQASGTTRVHLDLSDPNRPLQFTDVNDAKKLALIMPVQGPEDTYYSSSFAYCTVLDTAAGQVAPPTIPAPVEPPAAAPAAIAEPVPTIPTMPEPSQSATPGRNRRNPFYTYHAAGDRVRLLHRVGKCAVALIYPPGATVGFFALRYRQRTIEAGTYAKLTGAFAQLRAQDRAEVARLADRLSWHDVLPLAQSPACLLAFCEAHGLNPDLDYRRDELSRAITSRKLPKMAHYLNALNRAACPAN